MRLRAAFLLALSLSALSCRDLSRFDTKGKSAYCGQIVSGSSFNDGFTPDNVPQVLNLQLTLDTSQLSTFSEDKNEKAPQVGFLTSKLRDVTVCPGERLFNNAPLRGIPQVDHDALAALSFGEGHDEDFFAWVDSTCQGTMLAVVSLLRKGDVELRLFKPAQLTGEKSPPSENRPGFAVFYLYRREKGCDW